VTTKEWWFYKGIKFTHFASGRIAINGSPHTYSNYGKHNANDFTLRRLIWVFGDLERRFGIDLDKSVIHTLETGLNLILSNHSPTEILNALLLHKQKELNNFDLANSNGRFAKYGQYIIKTYDKGLQNRYRSEFDRTWRFEDKFTKAEQVNKLGIRTLADLRNPNKLILLADVLTKEWQNMRVFDKRIYQIEEFKSLSFEEQADIREKAEPQYWIDLHSKTGGRSSYVRERQAFEKWHSQFSTLKEDVAQAITDKFQPLREVANSTCPEDWEEMTAIATRTETEPLSEVGKNDSPFSPAIIAAREIIIDPEKETQILELGKNDSLEKAETKGTETQKREPKEEIEERDCLRTEWEEMTVYTSEHNFPPLKGQPLRGCFQLLPEELNEAFGLDELEYW
jgi:hypothetical protein